MGITRDREYNVTRGSEGSRILYFSANPNGEAEVIKVMLRPNPRIKVTSFEYDFSTLAINGRGSVGIILTKKPVRSIVKKEEGVSTLGARDIWFDDTVKRLNVAERGRYIGAFLGEDKILTVSSSGTYRHYNFDLKNHFDEDLALIEKFDPRKVMTAVFWDAAQEYVYVKRFMFEESEKQVRFIGDHPESRLLAFSLDYLPVLEVVFDEKGNGRPIETIKIEIAGFIGVKSYRAKGKRLTTHAVKTVKFLEPLPYELPEGSEDAVDEEITDETIDEGHNGEPEQPAPEDNMPDRSRETKKEHKDKSVDDRQIKLDL